MAYLQRLDDQLLEQKPKGWQVVGKRRRTVVTRFGEVCIERRLYRDKQGEGHFLLDKAIGLLPQQAATAEVQETVVAPAAEVSFGQAAAHLARMTAGVLSKSTAWRLLGAVGRRALKAEESMAQAVYEQGCLLPAGKRQAERIYVEADGVWVRLQREDKEWMEIRLGVAYDGWERLKGSGEKYRLQNKRVYVHGSHKVSFWEGASVAWWQVWDFNKVRRVVLNGDDAAWIEEGKHIFANAIRQQDGFHIARACQRALGRDEGQALYQALRQRKTEEVPSLWANARRKEGKQARRYWAWLEKHLDDPALIDWRLRVDEAPPDERGLGCMEGNIAHLIADRMKAKGRSWSPQGAWAMAKVRELVSNGELSLWCHRTAATDIPLAQQARTRSRRKQRQDPGDWLQASIPALQGRIPSDPTFLRLRQLISPRLPI